MAALDKGKLQDISTYVSFKVGKSNSRSIGVIMYDVTRGSVLMLCASRLFIGRSLSHSMDIWASPQQAYLAYPSQSSTIHYMQRIASLAIGVPELGTRFSVKPFDLCWLSPLEDIERFVRYLVMAPRIEEYTVPSEAMMKLNYGAVS